MKKIIPFISIFLLVMYCFFSSCSDFLEKPPSVDITVDSVYNNVVNAEKALARAYTGLPRPVPESWDNRNSVYAALFDQLADIATEREVSWGGALNWYKGNISIAQYNEPAGDDASRAKDQWFPDYYVNIRRALLVTRNVSRTPGMDPSYVKQIEAEGRLIAAINYYHMFINYGSVPFVGRALSVNEEINTPRPPLSVYMDSLLVMLNQCVADLPATIPPLERAGRMTKAAALSMIARTYWYAASPLFNASTPGYPYPDSDPSKAEHDLMICFGKEDPDLWVKAAEACKAAIDQAHNEGWSLLETGDYGDDFNNDYYNIFNGYQRGRPELIIGSHWQGTYYIGTGDVFANFFRPNQWQKGVITHNLVQMYDMKASGLPQTDPASGYNPERPYDGLDTRFYETCVWHSSRYSGTQYLFDSESSYWINNSGRSTGYLMKKFHPRNANEQSIWQWPYLRLADLYLMYAECLNEAYGPGNSEIYEYIGKIRQRAGVANIPQISDKIEMRERILKERAVELSLEGSRYYDLRRWKREDIFRTTIWGVKIIDENRNGSGDLGDGKLTLEPFDYPQTTLGMQRHFYKHWYYFPFPRAEVMKGYGLVQNPGWDDDNLVGRTLN